MNNKKIVEYKKYIMEKLDEITNEITREIMDKENVTSGDIFPEQVFELDEHYDAIAKILLKVVEQNKEI